MFKIKAGPQHFHGLKLYIADGWQEALAEFELIHGKNWLELTPGTAVSTSHRVNAYRVPLKDGRCVYFKTYSFHGQLTDYLMRQSKCATEVNSYQIIKKIGIPTIETVAFGEHRILGMLRSCCVVTIGVENTTQLEDFAFDTWYHMPQDEKTKAFDDIFNETALFTRKAHKANFFHYDLKWRNILVSKNEEGHYHTTWIDCPRGKKMTLRAKRGQMVDLSCLTRLALSYLTRSQRMRFLKVYLGDEATSAKIKELWRSVTDHLSRRMPSPVIFPDKKGDVT
ncbi:MAG: hypothetical protein HRT88_16015 [Lentisphaeraceae bacterium]|nr:hypothetical protein [Lentisphaeraceae bacterium]